MNLSDIVSGVTADSPLVVELKDSSTTDDLLNKSVVRNAAVSLFALPQKILGNWIYLLVFIVLFIIAAIIIKKLFDSATTEDAVRSVGAADKSVAPTSKASPVIILPGAGKDKKEEKTPDVLPDEEIVIEEDEIIEEERN